MRTLLRTLTSTVFIFAALGFVLAHYGTGPATRAAPPLTRHAAAAHFTVSYPSSWRQAPSLSVPRLALHGALTLAPTRTRSEDLVIGTGPPADARTLPAAFSASLAGSPQPQVVTLGSLAYYRYLDLSPHGEVVDETIYSLPTTIGKLTAVCLSAARDVAFTSNCERVLATLRLTSGRVMSLGVDAGYALAVNRILAQLNTVRTLAGPGLRAHGVKARARAADQLAAADDRAADAAHHIASDGVSVANMPLEGVLRLNGSAYRELARAALRGDQAAYQRAEDKLATSERALNQVYAQLRGFGYKIG